MWVALQIPQEFRDADPLLVLYLVRVRARLAVELATKDMVELVFGKPAPGIRSPIYEAEDLPQPSVETKLLLQSPVSSVLERLSLSRVATTSVAPEP